MINPKHWIAEVEQAPDGEYFIQLTDEILESTDFKIGDELDWQDNEDGSFTLKKKEQQTEETEFVLVEAIQQYRMRYIVEVPKGSKVWAEDTVVMEEAKEFSQYSLGETITSSRVIAKEDIIALCDEDNEYLTEWSDEQKFKAVVTRREDY